MSDKFMSMPYDKPADNCVAFMQVSVSDVARAQAFYEQVFGWTFQSQHYKPTIAVFKTGGQVMGALHLRAGDGDGDAAAPAPKGPVLNYVKVDDVEASLKKAAAAGGKVTKEKWNEGGHTDMGQFEDSEGNAWGLLHWLI